MILFILSRLVPAPAPDKEEEEKERRRKGAAEDAVESDTFLTEGPSHIGFDMTDSFDEADPPRQPVEKKGHKDTGKGYTHKVLDYLVRERVRFYSPDEAVSTKTKRTLRSQYPPVQKAPQEEGGGLTSPQRAATRMAGGAVPQSKGEEVCSPSPWRDAIRQGDHPRCPRTCWGVQTAPSSKS